ncbi:unnamed protein product [Amoebophrya sp. A25]|nr:unnamed protein product [Amoebophrya sp. A25]|eukprot:GSA25T00024285001.1
MAVATAHHGDGYHYSNGASTSVGAHHTHTYPNHGGGAAAVDHLPASATGGGGSQVLRTRGGGGGSSSSAYTAQAVGHGPRHGGSYNAAHGHQHVVAAGTLHHNLVHQQHYATSSSTVSQQVAAAQHFHHQHAHPSLSSGNNIVTTISSSSRAPAALHPAHLVVAGALNVVPTKTFLVPNVIVTVPYLFENSKLGLNLRSLTVENFYAPGAERFGWKIDDTIISVNGVRTGTFEAFNRQMSHVKVAKILPITFEVYRPSLDLQLHTSSSSSSLGAMPMPMSSGGHTDIAQLLLQPFAAAYHYQHSPPDELQHDDHYRSRTGRTNYPDVVEVGAVGPPRAVGAYPLVEVGVGPREVQLGAYPPPPGTTVSSTIGGTAIMGTSSSTSSNGPIAITKEALQLLLLQQQQPYVDDHLQEWPPNRNRNPPDLLGGSCAAPPAPAPGPEIVNDVQELQVQEDKPSPSCPVYFHATALCGEEQFVVASPQGVPVYKEKDCITLYGRARANSTYSVSALHQLPSGQIAYQMKEGGTWLLPQKEGDHLVKKTLPPADEDKASVDAMTRLLKGLDALHRLRSRHGASTTTTTKVQLHQVDQQRPPLLDAPGGAQGVHHNHYVAVKREEERLYHSSTTGRAGYNANCKGGGVPILVQ